MEDLLKTGTEEVVTEPVSKPNAESTLGKKVGVIMAGTGWAAECGIVGPVRWAAIKF